MENLPSSTSFASGYPEPLRRHHSDPTPQRNKRKSGLFGLWKRSKGHNASSHKSKDPASEKLLTSRKSSRRHTIHISHQLFEDSSGPESDGGYTCPRDPVSPPAIDAEEEQLTPEHPGTPLKPRHHIGHIKNKRSRSEGDLPNALKTRGSFKTSPTGLNLSAAAQGQPLQLKDSTLVSVEEVEDSDTENDDGFDTPEKLHSPQGPKAGEIEILSGLKSDEDEGSDGIEIVSEIESDEGEIFSGFNSDGSGPLDIDLYSYYPFQDQISLGSSPSLLDDTQELFQLPVAAVHNNEGQQNNPWVSGFFFDPTALSDEDLAEPFSFPNADKRQYDPSDEVWGDTSYNPFLNGSIQ